SGKRRRLACTLFICSFALTGSSQIHCQDTESLWTRELGARGIVFETSAVDSARIRAPGRVGDFNGDGYQDLALETHIGQLPLGGTSDLLILPGSSLYPSRTLIDNALLASSFVFRTGQQGETTADASIVELGDISGDGLNDLFVAWRWLRLDPALGEGT